MIRDTRRAELLVRRLRSMVDLRPNPEVAVLTQPAALSDFEILRETAPGDFASLERFVVDRLGPT